MKKIYLLLSLLILSYVANAARAVPSSVVISGASQTLCAGTSGTSLTAASTMGTSCGTNNTIAVTVTWYDNATNSTTIGTATVRQTTSVNYVNAANATPSPYTPATTGWASGTHYLFCVLSWGGAGCISAGSVTSSTILVTINSLTPNPLTLCPSSSASVTYIGSGTGGTWSISGLSGTSVSGGVVTSGVTAGTATVTYVVSGCTVTSSVTVQSNPTITTSSTGAFCGRSITASGAGVGGTYAWTPTTGLSSGAGATVTATPSVTTAYSVTGTTSTGCSSRAVFTVSATPTALISYSASCTTPKLICSSAIGSGSISSYAWSPTAGTSGSSTSTLTVPPSTTATYSVTVTASNTCTNTASYSFINLFPSPVITPSGSIVCSGTLVTLTGSGAVSYSWAGSTAVSPSTGATVTTTPLVTSVYTLTGTASSGCTATTTSTVTVGPCVNMPVSGTTTLSTCGATFYSSNGGSGTYSNSETGVYTFYPGTPGSLVRVTFSSFSVETCCDHLYAYNGNSVGATLIGTYDATAPTVITSSAADGSLTFKFTSDGSIVNSGWTATVVCIAGPPQVNPTPTSIPFGTITTGSSSSAQNITITGYNLTASGTITISAPSNFEVNNGTTWVSSYGYTYSGSTISSYTIPVRFNPSSSISYSGSITISGGGLASPSSITVTGTGALICTGTPTAGVTVSSGGGGCGSFSSTLSLSGLTVSGGLTYQWQSSPDNAIWSSVSGATNAFYAATGTSSTYFRCVVTCSATGFTGTSFPAYCEAPTCITMSNGSMSTCNAVFYSSGGSGGGYSNSEDYIYTIYPSTPGNKVKVTFNSFATESCCDYLSVFNGNSTGATLVGTYYNTLPGTSGVITSTAADGSLTFQFHSDGSITASGWSASVVCTTPSPCSGTPSPGSTVASVASGCAPYSSILSMSSPIAASGISCQWYKNTGSGFNAISGATNATYAATVSGLTESYRCTVSCYFGSSANSTAVTLTATPVITATGSPTSICQGTSVTLSNAAGGGTWSSSNSAIVTISATGVATGGTTAGTATLSYATTGCTQTYSLLNVLNPATITPATVSICNGATASLSNTVGGGTWSSANNALATVDASGIVTGVGVGSVNISYSTGCGTPVTRSVTVNTQPAAVTGSSSLCITLSTTLSNTAGGGTWTSSNTSLATVTSSTGIVRAQSTVGYFNIVYTIGSCSVTFPMSIGSSSPTTITGTASACAGASATLADAITGGLWSSSNTSVASVNATTGVVVGIGNGAATITYNNGCGTAATKAWTTTGTAVNLAYSSGGLTGPVCSGGTLSLTSGTSSGGTYSWTGPNSFSSASQNVTISSVTTAASGIYTFTGTVGACGAVTKYMFVSVDATPSVTATASPSSICSGGSAMLSESVLPATGTSAYVVHAVNYQLFDTTGTAIPSGDDGSTAATIPFSFNFFGTNYTTVYLSNNGYVNFGTHLTSGDYTTVTIPTTSSASVPAAMIALFWADLNTGYGGNIKYTTVGTAPNRKFVISYNNVAGYDVSTYTSNYNNGQVVLYEGSNIVEIYITRANFGSTHTPSCGIQNLTGSIGYAVPGRNFTSSYQLNGQTGTGYRFERPSYAYYWSPSTGLSATIGTSVISSGLTSTTGYVGTVIDAYSGCTLGGSNTTTLTVNPLPVVSLPANGCAGVAMTATGTSATYSWTPASGLDVYTGATATPLASVTASTTYTVTGTTAAGCVGTNTITAYPAPVVSVTPTSNTFCIGGSSTLTAAGAVTYSWSPATALSTTTGTSVSASPTVTRTYSLSGVSTNGCSSLIPATSTITVNAVPTISSISAPSSLCVGSGSITLTGVGASGSGALTSYNWSGPGGYSSTSATPSVILTPTSTAASGVYSLTVTYPGSGCVSAPVTTGTITVGSYPTAFNVTGGSGCTATGLTVGLDGSQSSGYTYDLKRGGTVVATLSGTSTTLTYSAVSVAGTYSVVAVGPGGCQADMNGTAVVNTTPSASVSAAMPNICQPTTSASIGLSSIAGSPNTYNVVWNATALGDGGFSNISGATLSGSSVTLIYNPLGGAGSFDGSLSLSNGLCTSALYPVHTIVHAEPHVAVSAVNVPCVGYAGSIDFTGTDSATVSYRVDGGSAANFIFTGTSHSLSTGVITSAHNYLVVDIHNAVCTTTTDPVIGTTITITPTPMAWVGGTGGTGHESEWNRVTNWSCGFVPTVSDDIQISAATFNPVVPGSFTATARNLTINSGAVLVVDGSGELDVKGSLNNSNEITGNGKIVLNGTSAQSITGIGAISNLELNNSAGAAITAGSRLILGRSLTVTSGTFITNDSLELASADTNFTGRIAELPSSGAAISGKVRVDQFVMGGYRRYRFFAHPFTDTISLGQLQTYIDITGPGGTANGFRYTASNAPSAFRLDPYTSNYLAGYDPGWKPFTKINSAAADTNKVHPGQGIRVFFRGAKGEGLGYAGYLGSYSPSSTIFKMTGNVNQGSVSIPLAQGVSATLQSFNMVGNPYPSPVDMGTVIWNARAAGQVTGGAFYVFDPAMGAGGQFVSVNLGGSAVPYYVQANTCIQVRADHDGAHIDFTESNKCANTSNYLFKTPVQYTRLSVYDVNNHMWDMLQFDFNDNATDDEDKMLDAVKPMGIADFNFYSQSADDQKLAVDSRPFVAEKVIPLGLTSGYQQQFVIRADNVFVPAGGKLVLHDKLLGKYVDINQGTEYAFTIGKDEATQGNRFELALKSNMPAPVKALAVTMSPNPTTDDVKVRFTSGKNEKVTIRVVDITGASIYNKDLGEQQNGTISVPLNTFAAGIYMVELTQGEQKVTQRLVKE
ncbi:hypothetical protein CJD36_021535 [Flavipsychrobacter stenotrophus]|uniref:CUB domain-containing protein n=1 Tax=Flavipsychrobacter stenotrophus TaxID=2077091 RepID=A0A2S7SQ27_9BACT|nr:CUB domain-containing protein [Flavipsychrobacter stenotrophus]PQJ08990.1 hypothetical protein CJD36_021535 [Flavipsychrobacter stenotrophus]